MALSAGTRLGPYEILEPLGAGGMGEVLKAKDTRLQRTVAVKVLPTHLSSDAERRGRFEREARSASALNHPNITTVFDIGEHEGTHYIVMELVEGKTLRELLDEGPLSTERMLPLATQIAEGLSKAHAAGIVHRDLKPENVMVTEDGLVKILDFGLAKLMPQGSDVGSEAPTETKATRQGTVLGTVPYMSPEQAAGRSLDYRSDQFSFGSILYEMATGKRAFKEATTPQTLAAIIEDDPEPIRKLNEAVPVEFVGIVERCLAKDPAERYESTGDVARELKTAPETPSVWRARRRFLWAAVGVLIALLAVALGPNLAGLWDQLTSRAGPASIESIAVLPLQNLSGDPEQEYFVDAITEALITDLAKISALKVIARGSAMRYKDTDQAIAQIAEELGVHAMITGSVLRSGDRVRVTVQLIEAETDQYLWADSFDRELRDTLALYSDVARAIAQEIEVAMTPGENARLVRTRRVDPNALELYVQGRYHYNRMPHGLEKANELFQQAIEIDPGFPQAHAALAYSYIVLNNRNFIPPDEAFPKAKAAALKAQEMDDTLAETQKALIGVRWSYERDWPGADRALARALEISPGDPDVLGRYALRLSMLGRHDEATAEIRKAWELDPNAPVQGSGVGGILYLARRYEQAIQHLQRMVEVHPDFHSNHFNLSLALLKKGKRAEATEEAEQGVELTGHPGRWNWLAYVYANAGREDEARKILRDLEREPLSEGWIAAVHTALGDKDRAFAWLDRAYDAYDSWLFRLHDPIWDPLRDDPRFENLLRRLNNPYRPPAGENAPDKGTAS